MAPFKLFNRRKSASNVLDDPPTTTTPPPPAHPAAGGESGSFRVIPRGQKNVISFDARNIAQMR
jgi:hypothetical protein